MVLLRLELRLQDSKSWVLTNYTIKPYTFLSWNDHFITSRGRSNNKKSLNTLMQITLPDHLQEYQTLASFFLTRVKISSGVIVQSNSQLSRQFTSKGSSVQDISGKRHTSYKLK
ncbi:hypothetical protein ACTA71_003291 [Dictyostelium dimigraforme]